MRTRTCRPSPLEPIDLSACLAHFTHAEPLKVADGSGFRCPACHARAAVAAEAEAEGAGGEDEGDGAARDGAARANGAYFSSPPSPAPPPPLVDATRRLVWSTAPRVLVVHMKRLLPFYKVCAPSCVARPPVSPPPPS